MDEGRIGDRFMNAIEPFASKVPARQLFTPEESCGHLSRVLENLQPADSGSFFAWDGQSIPY